MNITFDIRTTEKYHSASQIARVLTETWVYENMYCPRCGNLTINKFENNRPVADFFCPSCQNEYELKSKSGSLCEKVNDGAYDTMIKRITSKQNPDFFFMNYSKTEYKVKDFIIVPKHFFTLSIIEKRKPLALTARRAGWVGCNILIGKIPEQGRISIIENGNVLDKNKIIKQVNRSIMFETCDLDSRGWLMDVLNCINSVENNFFTLSEIYSFENVLQIKHPNNNNVKPKIRQQLQFLRDKGFIEFLGNGKYRKMI